MKFYHLAYFAECDHFPLHTVLIQEPESSIFIFISNHSIGDGVSVLYVIRDILTVLSGNVIGKLAPLPSLDVLIGNVSGNQMNLNLTGKSDEPSKEKKSRAPFKLDRLSLSSELTTKLAERSRLEKTTVHGAISAALIMAGRLLSKEWNQQPVNILHPVSNRTPLEIGEEYGLYLSIVVRPYDPETGTLLWDLARSVKDSISDVSTKESIREDTSRLSQLFNGQMDGNTIFNTIEHVTNHQILLTNLARTPFDTNFGELKIKSIWGPIVLPGVPGAQTIGVSTTNNVLTLTQTSSDLITGLLQTAADMLKSACD